MHKLSPHLIATTVFGIAVLAAAPFASAQSTTPAAPAKGEIKQDRERVRQDRQEIRDDRKQLREAVKAGDKQGAEAARKELKADRERLRQDKAELKRDIQDRKASKGEKK